MPRGKDARKRQDCKDMSEKNAKLSWYICSCDNYQLATKAFPPYEGIKSGGLGDKLSTENMTGRGPFFCVW
jgi:hypothetical protein